MLTSRERVVMALNHEEPDRVPLDLGGTGSSGINVMAYNRLRKHLGLEPDQPLVFDLMQQICQVGQDVLEMLNIDCVPLYRSYPRFGIDVERTKDWILRDGTHCRVPADFNPVKRENGDNDIVRPDGTVIARMPLDGDYYDDVGYPMANVTDESELEKFLPPLMSDYELENLRTRGKALYEKTDYAIIGAFGGSLFETSLRSFGFSRFMEDLLLEPEFCETWLDMLSKRHAENIDRYLDAVGDYLCAIQFSDDLGTQKSPMISPNTYREVIKPYHHRMYSEVKRRKSDVKVLLHCCGSIQPMIGDLIEAGVDALNPVQISADNMDPVKLKKDFGEHITFWGGCANMQHTVRTGSLADIRSEVEYLIKTFKPGGGLVFSQVHNIVQTTPADKIMCIYETANRFRDYER